MDGRVKPAMTVLRSVRWCSEAALRKSYAVARRRPAYTRLWHRVREMRPRVSPPKLFRTGIDDLPQLFAVLDLLHGGGEPAVAADPVLHRVRIIRHQVGGAFVARDLDAEGECLVVIGEVETDAGARGDADLVQRHDAEHQRARRIADAVDDDALLAVADALVLRLVFRDIAAVIAGDMKIGPRR